MAPTIDTPAYQRAQCVHRALFTGMDKGLEATRKISSKTPIYISARKRFMKAFLCSLNNRGKKEPREKEREKGSSDRLC
jgi:hypothetical protein